MLFSALFVAVENLFMHITLEKIIPIEQAFARLRYAPLDAAGDKTILVFEDASIRLCDFRPQELNPMSCYVLRRNLELQRELRTWLLQQHNIDTLQLSSLLALRTDEGIIGMAPPIVEIYEELIMVYVRMGDRLPPPRAVKIPIIQDGIHRMWLGRELGIPVRTVTIEGALREHLPYAYPNSWHEVQIYESPPEMKKHYRRMKPYSFMRPFHIMRQVEDTPPPVEWGRK